MSDPAPEGSDERRWARSVLFDNAQRARRRGDSFDGWLEGERQTTIDTVTQKDLDVIFQIVWKAKRPIKATPSARPQRQ